MPDATKELETLGLGEGEPSTLEELADFLGNLADEDLIDPFGDYYGSLEYEDVAGISPDDPNRFEQLKAIGHRLGTRFEHEGDMEDLTRAIEVTEMAIDALAPEHGDEARADMIAELGHWLYTHYAHTKSLDSLNRSIIVTDQALTAMPEDDEDPERAAVLGDLGNRLHERFEENGSIADLVRAIQVTGTALKGAPDWGGYPDRAELLENLRDWLVQWEENWSRPNDLSQISPGDLDDSIAVLDAAVVALPEDHPHRPPLLNNLGTRLSERFQRTASMNDLNRAIEVAEIAIAGMTKGNPHRPIALGNLGCHLGARFELVGSLKDLEDGVKATDEARKTIPLDHSSRWKILTTLGNQLSRLFERTGRLDDIDRAVDACEEALQALPEGSKPHDRVACLVTLGTSLNRRYQKGDAIDDLDRAIQVFEEAVKLTSVGDLERGSWLHNLGASLGSRYEKTQLPEDLDKAIEHTKMALQTTSADHPSRADKLYSLSTLLVKRHRQTPSDDDFNNCLSLCRDAWECPSSRPFIRILAAWRAALLLAANTAWIEAAALLQGAVNLLPLVSPRYLQDSDKQDMISSFSGLAADACAVTLNAGDDNGEQALETLELGRGVVNGLLLEMRTDASDLEAEHPDLAEEFRLCRDALDSPLDVAANSISGLGNVGLSATSRLNQRHETTERFDRIVAKIRTHAGFERFLLPPTADEMMAAARAGPIVVVNVSHHRSDAFLVQKDSVSVLELPNLTVKAAERHARQIRLGRDSYGAPRQIKATLEWLWHVITEPVLKALGLEKPPPAAGGEWPHIWWIPTGVISNLPLHAAGCHTEGSTEAVLERAMSSYSSSIKSLIYTRRHSARAQSRERILLCSMPETPGLRSLTFATAEATMLKDLCPALRLAAVEPPREKAAVLEQLRTCSIFHFAGHGLSDPTKPLGSCLMLEDWKRGPLTVADLRDSRLQESAPFLSFLSACETGVNDERKLADEGIHLVSACQVAGFRHVVGTLWAASDRHCVDVATVFYETLRDEGINDRAVCLGLHRAVRELRKVGIASTAADRGLKDADNGPESDYDDDDYDGTDDEQEGQGESHIGRNLRNWPRFPRVLDPAGKHGEVYLSGSRDGRNARLKSRNRRLQKPMYWVPYIHFGV
ncbi:hypothetical protein ACJ41O_011658 [Fusarium nematophilum]